MKYGLVLVLFLGITTVCSTTCHGITQEISDQTLFKTDSPAFAGMGLSGNLDMNSNDITEIQSLTCVSGTATDMTADTLTCISGTATDMTTGTITSGEETKTGDINLSGYTINGGTLSYVQSAFTETVNTVAHWGFDEGTGTSIADVSGNGNDSVTFGSVLWSTTNAKFGNALNCNGQYAIMGNCSTLQRSSFTICLWVYFPATTSGTDTLIAKAVDSTHKEWWLATDNGLNQVNFSISTDGTNSSYQTGDSWETDVPINKWTMLTVTFNGTTITKYMNQWLDSTVQPNIVGQTYRSDTSSVTIGSLYNNGTNTFAGLIDEVIIENGLWTADDVKRAYYSGRKKFTKMGSAEVDYGSEVVFLSSPTVNGQSFPRGYLDPKITNLYGGLGVWTNSLAIRQQNNRISPFHGNRVAVSVGTIDPDTSAEFMWDTQNENPEFSWTASSSKPLEMRGLQLMVGGFLPMVRTSAQLEGITPYGTSLGELYYNSDTLELNYSTATGKGSFAPVGYHVTGDQTITGNVFASSVTATNMVRQGSTWHLYISTYGSQTTIDNGLNTWHLITNATNDLLGSGNNDLEGFAIVTDSVSVTNAADYFGTCHISYDSGAANNWEFRFINITQNNVAGFSRGPTTTGAGTIVNVYIDIYMKNVAASDIFALQIRNITDTDDIVIDDISLNLLYNHD